MLALALTTLVAAALDLSPRRHNDTESYAHFWVTAERTELRLEFDIDHLMQSIDTPPPEGGDWTEEEMKARLPGIERYVAPRWRCLVGGQPLAPHLHDFEILRSFDPLLQGERAVRVSFSLDFTPPDGDATVEITPDLLAEIELLHRHVIYLEVAGRPTQELLAAPGVPLHFTLPDLRPGAGRRVQFNAALAGARENLRAPWLLAFAVALAAAPATRRRRGVALAAAIATTLLAGAVARADWIAPAAWAAAAAAALSASYVAFENFTAADERPLRFRGATAALFGLVHGMQLDAAARAGTFGTSGATGSAFSGGAVAVALAAGALVTAAIGPSTRCRSVARVICAAALVTGAIGAVIAFRHS